MSKFDELYEEILNEAVGSSAKKIRSNIIKAMKAEGLDAKAAKSYEEQSLEITIFPRNKPIHLKKAKKAVESVAKELVNTKSDGSYEWLTYSTDVDNIEVKITIIKGELGKVTVTEWKTKPAYLSHFDENCRGMLEDNEKVYDILNYAGFDREEVQVGKDGVKIAHKNKRKLDALRMEVQAELTKAGMEFKTMNRKFDGDKYYYTLTVS